MKLLALLLVPLVACRSSDGRAKSTATAGSTATPTTRSAASHDELLLERADRARIQGDSVAPVWLVEISDFECPFCKRWHDETYPTLMREYVRGGTVRMAYVNFPLGQHPHAMPAAEAAMCAAAQDQFWPMHDALFGSQNKWAALPDAGAYFDSLATVIGVNAGEWRDCARTHLMQRLILADRNRGQTAGVKSTPTFFVGDEPIEGAQPIDAFRAAIGRALAKAGRRPAQ